MYSIECHDCGHIVMVKFGHKSKIGRGCCGSYGAVFEVEVRQTQKSPMSKEQLEARKN